MKYYIAILLAFLCACGPTYHIQQHFLESDLKKDNTGAYFFEDSSILIRYDFYSRGGGQYVFLAYNKTNKPLYIDWKKSSLIINSRKVDLWQDNSKSTGNTITDFNHLYYNSYYANYLYQYSNTATYKPERITAIPPKAFFLKGFNVSVSVGKLTMNDTAYFKEPVYNGDRRRFDSLYVFFENYPNGLPNYQLRTFFVYSYSESFQDEIYVDNSFKVNRVIEYRPLLQSKYASTSSFYWQIEMESTAEIKHFSPHCIYVDANKRRCHNLPIQDGYSQYCAAHINNH